jgi:site-specific DNA-methyltransferase (adenine-specific)
MVELNHLYNEDCILTMQRMENNSVDLILTDPPYGVNLKYDTYIDTEENWYNLMSNFIPEAKRVAKMVIMPSCKISRLEWIYKNFPPDWLICWYKGSVGTAAFIGFNDWEPHLVYGKNNTNMHDYFRATPEPQTNGHPCQKPVNWARWLIKRATNENDIVYDPFTGSVTTIVASIELKRNFIGSEISKEYYKMAEKRIKPHLLQTSLF